MNAAKLRLTVAIAALCGLGIAPALAQRQPPSPEQRIERLENQLRDVQRRVFPRGEPAATAGFPDDPAATQASVIAISDRLSALERQVADVLRQTEENGNRTRQIESELTRLRSNQDVRLRAIESALQTMQTAPSVEPTDVGAAPPRPSADAGPVVSRPLPVQPTTAPGDPAEDPAELAYDEGFQLWRDGRHDQAIVALRAMASSFPGHRRVSWANNLAGRAMLDKGDARPAAEALLANYRGNPRGERAADSLFYLGQALMKLNQASQACRAYSELEAVYGASIRGELQRLLPEAKAEANCS